ncbi:DUF4386 domain-containing protein [Demequina sp. SYSU T00192]|uniref:DUF4386 domain-containing protein n=1 Tax=Demequina litoralis TaxID=3051660 RepID=A0ABT8GBG9_9MICO|nr:DUF4386 domain-containing protein [Demequina sp. SYSU T00192]MDN4476491.1 DUF4386 domain-containing protein [Demequina sp. SYSU T00192]
MNVTTDLSPRSAARLAGLGYIAIVLLAMGANFLVRNQLVVLDDPAATMANIAENETTFRFGIAGFAAIAMIDIGIAWALHVLLRHTGERRSLLAAWLRLAYTVAFIPAITFMYLALQLAVGGDIVAGLDAGQREAWTGLAMEAFDITWLLALVAFGLHLMVLGRILVASRIGPRALGYGLGIAGVAYVADTFAHLLLANYADFGGAFLAIVATASIVTEVWFTVWLLTRAPRAVAALPGREPDLVTA